MKRQTKILVGLGVPVGVCLLAYLGTFISVVLSAHPLAHPLASLPVWPIACTTRGCITTATWSNQHRLADAFATATSGPRTTEAASLTSLVRKHLITHSFLRSPVKTSDTQRYRENILHIVNESDLQQYVPLTLAEYDKQVLMPFLQQEALLTQNKVESTDELYGSLAGERRVILLLSHFRWDTATGAVHMR